MAGGDDAGLIAGTGGVGPIGGAGGAAGDPTGGDPEEPKPGEAYNPCRDDGSCDLPMFCTFDVTNGGARYCAPVCNGNGVGALGCPRRRDGSFALCVRNLCMR